MAGSVEQVAGFWLPTEFLDDFVTDKEYLGKNHAADSVSEFCFPTEFPYDFQPETGDNLKEKRRVMSTSPQSTLSHLWTFSARSAGGSSNGSPNVVTSPPATPLGAENDAAVEELIHRAAGQVAKLKLNTGDLPRPAKIPFHTGPSKSLDQLYPMANKRPSPSVFHNFYLEEQMMKQQKQGSRIWHGEPQMYNGWPVKQNPTLIGRSGSKGVLFGGAAAVKRECAGTGVFLPRRYVKNTTNDCANACSSDSRKRTGHSSASYIPERNVHALNNKNFDRINGYVPSQPQFQPKFNPGFVSEYDMLMARRNALIVQHRSLLLEKSSPMSHGICLPQEWTY